MQDRNRGKIRRGVDTADSLQCAQHYCMLLISCSMQHRFKTLLHCSSASVNIDGLGSYAVVPQAMYYIVRV